MEIIVAFIVGILSGCALAYAWYRNRIDPQLGAAREQAQRASLQAAGLERANDTLQEQLLETARRSAAFEERARLMGDTKQALENTFRALSSEALRSNNESFLSLAKASLVGPVKESLDKVDEKIGALERSRQHAYGEIRQQFAQMAEVQSRLREETGNLVKALRQPHVRGRWGEIQLRRVVEMAGMMLHCDFVEQESADSDDGKLRPDLIVKLPGNRQIVVDSKAPISAYMEAHEATTDELRKAKILLHAQLMRRHLDSLAR